jgi:hypothetical protein
MTRRRLLTEVDSAELTAWLAYFEAKQERDEEERKRVEFERRIGA